MPKINATEPNIFDSDKIREIQEKDSSAKISDIVYSILEEGILSSAIAPGTKLNAKKIAEQLGISNTPVSKAIQLLNENGLVTDVSGNNGKYSNYYVFDISNDSINDLFIARGAIESAAASICAQRHTLIDIDKLGRLAKEFQEVWQDYANDSGSAASVLERAKIDEEFHRLIVLYTDNKYMIDMFKNIQDTLRYLSIRASEFAEIKKSRERLLIMGPQHMAIYNAIKLGIPEMAGSAMSSHLDFCRYHCILNRANK